VDLLIDQLKINVANLVVKFYAVAQDIANLPLGYFNVGHSVYGFCYTFLYGCQHYLTKWLTIGKVAAPPLLTTILRL